VAGGYDRWSDQCAAIGAGLTNEELGTTYMASNTATDLDLFKSEWTFTRGLTLDLLDSLTDAELSEPPAPRSRTVLEAVSSRWAASGMLPRRLKDREDQIRLRSQVL
jgi:hypothetical protein